MATVVLVLVLALALILTVTGVLAMTTGRIALPWVRKGVTRPRVWGAGTLLIAASLAATWLVPFRGQSLLMLVGLALIWRAQSRRHREPPQGVDLPKTGLTPDTNG
ncbi:hypothetical protein ABZX97_02830 [Streptomyces seoulensis]|uniref:hypothetical protein n=1 Tax=Streptomyces seoulensis TaxID=73044 RepID=UPI0033B348C9